MTIPKPQPLSKPGKPPITLRLATPADLEPLTRILIASFPADPEWNYRYPYAAQYPDDHWKYTLQRVSDYFENTTRNAARMVVAEMPAATASSTLPRPTTITPTKTTTSITSPPQDKELLLTAPTKIPIGFAIWALPYSHGTSAGDPERELRFPPNPASRRDADHKHTQAYFSVMYDAKTRIFDQVYGEQQMHLCLLAVDPAYQGFGAGTGLVREGLEVARGEECVATLFATGPGGRVVYKRCGFREGEWLRVGPVEGESEVLEFPAMVWDGK